MGLFVAERDEMDKKQGKSHQSSSTKVERRVIEKNRRNHMKLLHSNLNSLLPHLNSKEAPSVPEQIDEAINYIKSLESKLEKSKEKKKSLMGQFDKPRKRSHNYNNKINSNSDFESIMRSPSTAAKSPQIQIHEMASGSSTSTLLEVVFITATGIHAQNHYHHLVFYEIIRILDEEQADIVHASFSTSGDSMVHLVRAEMGKCLVDNFGAARITEKLRRFVNESASDEELPQDYFWDFEIDPAAETMPIWDQL